MKRFIKSHWETLFFVCLCAGLVYTFFVTENNVKCIDLMCVLLGFIGTLYILYRVFMWFVFPVERDRALVSGGFLPQVGCFVLSVPFVFSMVAILGERDLSFEKGDCYIRNNKDSLKREIVYDENMYVRIPKTDTCQLANKDSIPSAYADFHAALNGWKKQDSIYTYTELVDDVPVPVNEIHEEPHVFWSIYYHFIDPGNQHMASSQTGRVWAALAAMFGVFLLNGLLITSFIGWLDNRKEKWVNGEIRYNPCNWIRNKLAAFIEADVFKNKLEAIVGTNFVRNKFAVVIGANEVASSVVKNLLTKNTESNDLNFKCERNNNYVILQTSRDPQTVREELTAHLPAELVKKVIIYKALRNSKEEIAQLHLEHATEIYILGESVTNDGGETYHDAMNMECVNHMANLLELTREERRLKKEKCKNAKNTCSVKKVCKVMFEYQTTFSIFQFSDITKIVKENLVFIPFNRYESWARKVIVDGKSLSDCDSKQSITYTPLDGYSGIKLDSEEYVHFIVVGMSKMGVAMGVQAMLQAHYLNGKKKKTRISFIDTNADKEMAFFKGRYSNLFELARHRFVDCDEKYSTIIPCNWDNCWIDPIDTINSRWRHLADDDGKSFIDIEIEFVKGSIESDGVREYLCQAVRKEHAKVTIAVCLVQTHQAIAASLYMPVEVYKSKQLQEVWVYQSESADIVSSFEHSESKDLRYKKLRPFGMQFGVYIDDRTRYLKAMLVNAAYDINVEKTYSWPNDMADKNDSIYRKVCASWSGLSVDKKWSNKYFVDSMYLKVKSAMCNEGKSAEFANLLNDIKEGRLHTSTTIADAISRVEAPLAECEHNRWNVQQLLLGYSACDEELTRIFELVAYKDSTAKTRYAVWARDNLHRIVDVSTVKPKNDVKESELRIHPNICSYNRLDSVDPDAKPYDSMLNKAIPKILELVDLRPLKLKS